MLSLDFVKLTVVDADMSRESRYRFGDLARFQINAVDKANCDNANVQVYAIWSESM